MQLCQPATQNKHVLTFRYVSLLGMVFQSTWLCLFALKTFYSDEMVMQWLARYAVQLLAFFNAINMRSQTDVYAFHTSIHCTNPFISTTKRNMQEKQTQMSVQKNYDVVYCVTIHGALIELTRNEEMVDFMIKFVIRNSSRYLPSLLNLVPGQNLKWVHEIL